MKNIVLIGLFLLNLTNVMATEKYTVLERGNVSWVQLYTGANIYNGDFVIAFTKIKNDLEGINGLYIPHEEVTSVAFAYSFFLRMIENPNSNYRVEIAYDYDLSTKWCGSGGIFSRITAITIYPQ